MPNKNLVYTITTKNYDLVFKMFLKTFKKFNSDCDLLCLCDKDVYPKFEGWPTPPFYFWHHPKDFDYKFKSRYTIQDSPYWNQYDNFLYLDNDILCLADITPMFNTIESQPSLLHTVQECEDVASYPNKEWYRISNFYGKGYCSGIFGFTNQLLPVFPKFCDYIDNTKHLAINDQPLFNEYFVEKQLLCGSLSKFVPFNSQNLNQYTEAVLNHYAGGYADFNHKIDKMRQDYTKIMKGIF